MAATDPHAESAERFTRDTAHHQMTVLHDDGLYRHLRFRAPEHGAYWFDLITWPYNLVITGDMDAFHFSRAGSDTEDMPTLFRGRRINPGYWAGKLRAGRADAQEYSEAVFAQTVWTYVREGGQEYRGLAKAVQAEIFDTGYSLDEQTAREALEDFEHADADTAKGREFRFHDVWEMSFKDWTAQYLWACHAIVWGIRQYDQARAAMPAEAVTR